MMVLNPQLFCQQIDKKLPNGKINCEACFFFHKCSYKISSFSELLYNTNGLVLMVYNYKDVLKDCLNI